MDKLLIAERYQIKISCVTDGSKLDYLDTMDLYALFGNALDNAIESVSKEQDKAKRVISLRIGTREGFLAIHLENYVGTPVKIVHGLPVTTKADTRYHGFGMLSMRRIAEKYHGYMNAGMKDHTFSLDFLIPLPTT
jgi:sensor histidine kinase regulating citrate/malate metabolism